MLKRASVVRIMAMVLTIACSDRDEVDERCDRERAVCPQLSTLLRGVAAQEGAVTWRVDSARVAGDTAWTLNILLQLAAGDTATVLPRGLTCENFLALGVWDNPALSGPAVLTVPAERWSDNCADVNHSPIPLRPGLVVFWRPVHEADLSRDRLRALVRGDDAWAAAIIRRDSGDSIVVAKVPRFR
jgi:hypothetical protein